MKRKSALREIRESIGLTQMEMAQLLGLDPGTYPMIETERRNLTGIHLDRLVALSQILEKVPEPTGGTPLETNKKIKILEDILILLGSGLIRKERALEKELNKQKARQRLDFLCQNIERMAHPKFKAENDLIWASTIQESKSLKRSPKEAETTFLLFIEVELLRQKIDKLEEIKAGLQKDGG
jgi:transcriptional regulator with XRE-family HTH domain